MSPDGPAAPARRAFRPEPVTVRCPACGNPVSGEAVTIVDAANDADREALLSGRLNMVSCSACRQVLVLDAPLLYVDTEREVALVYLPGTLGTSREEGERSVGRLTNRVLDALDPEFRKSYLLQPRTFFTRQTFSDALLEANGISADEVARAKESALLLDELAAIGNDLPAIRRKLEEAHRLKDTTLPQLAAAMADEAAERGDQRAAASLGALADALLDIVGPATVTVDEVLEALQRAKDADALTSAVANLRPVLDYAFFAELTSRADAAAPEEAGKLRSLRAGLLAAIDEHDALLSATMERAQDSLRAILDSSEPVQAAQRRAAALDGAFLSVLQSRLQEASSKGQKDLVAKLVAVREAVLQALEARMPPRQRLVNQLARARDQVERGRVLDQAADLNDAETEAAIQGAVSQARAMGATDVVQRLEAAAGELRRRMGNTNEAQP